MLDKQSANCYAKLVIILVQWLWNMETVNFVLLLQASISCA